MPLYSAEGTNTPNVPNKMNISSPRGQAPPAWGTGPTCLDCHHDSHRITSRPSVHASPSTGNQAREPPHPTPRTPPPNFWLSFRPRQVTLHIVWELRDSDDAKVQNLCSSVFIPPYPCIHAFGLCPRPCSHCDGLVSQPRDEYPHLHGPRRSGGRQRIRADLSGRPGRRRRRVERRP